MPENSIQRLIAIDYSGDKSLNQRRKIWSAVWTAKPQGRTAGGTVTLEAGRTREELTYWLMALARETPAVVVGIDCCFSFPAWFLAEHGCKSIFDFWRHVAAGHGERWLGTTVVLPEERDQRFWGKPHKRPVIFSGENRSRMMRRTDMENKVEQALEGGDLARAAKMKGITPKSPFQIGGSGSVGTGSLRAMPWLLLLAESGFRVWPFQGARLISPEPQPLLVEMYTRLLTGPVAKSNPVARKLYLATRRATDPLYSGLPRAVFASALGSEDAFDALVCCLEMLRHKDEFATLQATEDSQLQLEGITWRPGV